MCHETKEFIDLHTFWKNYGKLILDYGKIPPKSNTGVGGNTYRAYGRFCNGHQPSKVFEKWVNTHQIEFKSINEKNFDVLHRSALNSLICFWEQETTTQLVAYPYAAKLIDLYFKHVAWHSLCQIDEKQRQILLKVLYQPLDKYSLMELRNQGIQLNDRNIPQNPRMGLIDSKEKYKFMQDAISNICRENAEDEITPNFAFDQYAWNL
jgi:hypothetical protein